MHLYFYFDSILNAGPLFATEYFSFIVISINTITQSCKNLTLHIILALKKDRDVLLLVFELS